MAKRQRAARVNFVRYTRQVSAALQLPAAPVVMSLAIALVTSCASTAASQSDTTATQGSGWNEMTPAEEQRAIDAARRHPVAQPEPRTLYPDQSPPERPARGLPEQTPPPRTDAPAPQGQQQYAPLPPPVEPYGGSAATTVDSQVITYEAPPAPRQEAIPAAPAPNYVWAPGYWYWFDNSYVWINGSWLSPRPGYVYVGARWNYGRTGWVFAPGGWALGIGGAVVYPVYRHRYLYEGWPYYRRQHYWNHQHQHRHYGHAPRHYDRDRSYRGSWAREDRHRDHNHHDRGKSRTYSRPRDPGVRGSNRSSAAPRSSGGSGRHSVPARRR